MDSTSARKRTPPATPWQGPSPRGVFLARSGHDPAALFSNVFARRPVHRVGVTTCFCGRPIDHRSAAGLSVSPGSPGAPQRPPACAPGIFSHGGSHANETQADKANSGMARKAIRPGRAWRLAGGLRNIRRRRCRRIAGPASRGVRAEIWDTRIAPKSDQDVLFDVRGNHRLTARRRRDTRAMRPLIFGPSSRNRMGMDHPVVLFSQTGSVRPLVRNELMRKHVSMQKEVCHDARLILSHSARRRRACDLLVGANRNARVCAVIGVNQSGEYSSGCIRRSPGGLDVSLELPPSAVLFFITAPRGQGQLK